MRNSRFIVAALPLLAVAVALSQPQDPAQETAPADEFFGSVEVRLVNLDVVVTDRSGHPVTGLGAADFDLRVDGRPVDLQHFYAPPAVASSADTSPGVTPPPPTSSQAKPSVGAASETRKAPRRETSLIIYVDDFHLRPEHRTAVLRRVRQFLESSASIWDRMMVVSYDRSVKLRQPFTTDRRAVEAALVELEGTTAYGSQYASDRREVLRYIQDHDNADDVTARIRQQSEQIRNDLEFSTDALREFVDSLSGVAGRKILLHVSDGMAMEPAADLLAAAQAKFGGAIHPLGMTGPSLGRTYHEIAAIANTAGVTFYMMDAAGLRVGTAMDLSIRAPAAAPLADTAYRLNQQSPLTLMSEATGGKAILNTNDPTVQLESMARDQEVHYSLAFTPPDGTDERYHRVEVRVGKPGLEVRCRDGYRVRDASRRLADGVEAMLRYRTQSNPLAVVARSDRGAAAAQGLFAVHLLVEMPYDEVTFVPRGEMRVAQIEYAVKVRDAKGRESDLVRKKLPLEIPLSDFASVAGQPLRYRLELRMRPGWHSVGVGVRDTIGGKQSLVYLDVNVGAG
jgi:VWFA-related protein